MRWLALLLLVGCANVQTGGGYMDSGWNTEITAMAVDDSSIGTRVAFGQMEFPDKWAALYGRRTSRVALSALYQHRLPAGFYIEPRLDVAYYDKLHTPYELEFGFRAGWRKDKVGIYLGVRHPLGNGDRHEDEGEYRHIPDGWRLESGLFLFIDF